MDVYVPNPITKFELPIIWLMLHICHALLIGSYPSRDISGFGKYMLIRARKRGWWWLCKCVWVVLCVLVYFSIIYAVALAFAVFSNGLTIKNTSDIFQVLFGMDTTALTCRNFFIYVIILPFLVSITISLLQALLSFFMRPILSFLTVIVLMVSSAYFFTPLLIGNSSMLLRSAAVIPNGIMGTTSIVIQIILIGLFAVIGYIRLEKYDILGSK
jgi:hypothetical protein